MTSSYGKDEEAVRAVIAKWFDSYMAHDVDSMLSCHSENLIVIPQGADPMYGLDAWRELLDGALDKTDQENIDHRVQDVIIGGDVAWAWYLEWKSARVIETGEQKCNYVKGSHTLRRQPDGEWKIERYMWNVNPVEGDPEAHKRAVLSKIPSS